MKRLAFLALIILGIPACTYYDDSTYEVKITPGDLPSVSIHTTFDSITGDILIADSMRFNYSISVDTGFLYLTEFYFQESYLFVNDTNAASLWIKPNTEMDTSAAEFLMRIYYSTNSGSLADLIHSEYARIDTAWTIKFKPEV